MLTILCKIPDFYTPVVDNAFRDLSLRQIQQAGHLISCIGGCHSTSALCNTPADKKFARNPVDVIEIETPFGAATLNDLPEGTKALMLAYTCKCAGKRFCCNIDVFGETGLPLYGAMAEDTDLLYAYSATGYARGVDDIDLQVRSEDGEVYPL